MFYYYSSFFLQVVPDFKEKIQRKIDQSSSLAWYAQVDQAKANSVNPDLPSIPKEVFDQDLSYLLLIKTSCSFAFKQILVAKSSVWVINKSIGLIIDILICDHFSFSYHLRYIHLYILQFFFVQVQCIKSPYIILFSVYILYVYFLLHTTCYFGLWNCNKREKVSPHCNWKHRPPSTSGLLYQLSFWGSVNELPVKLLQHCLPITHHIWAVLVKVKKLRNVDSQILLVTTSWNYFQGQILIQQPVKTLNFNIVY